jgi:hypothetical protein
MLEVVAHALLRAASRLFGTPLGRQTLTSRGATGYVRHNFEVAPEKVRLAVRTRLRS